MYQIIQSTFAFLFYIEHVLRSPPIISQHTNLRSVDLPVFVLLLARKFDNGHLVRSG
jgi:hypothetical protein